MSSNNLYMDFFDLEDFTIGRRKDNIVVIYVKEGKEVNQEMQYAIFKHLLQLKQPGVLHPVILEGGDFVSISSNVVEHTKIGFKEHVLCVAFVAKNMADRIVGKYFSKKYKTSSEFVFFDTMDEAVSFCYENMNKVGMNFTPLL